MALIRARVRLGQSDTGCYRYTLASLHILVPYV